MLEFIKTMMDWVLKKEQEAAKNCYIDAQEVEKQIETLKTKRAQLKKKFEEEDAEFAHVLSRLTLIKANAAQCERK